MTRTRRISAAAALIGVAVACTSDESSNKAGGAAPPVVIRVGTDDSSDAPAARQILEFARQVDVISNGSITVEPVWHAAGTGVPDWDQAVARMVMNGEIEAGLIPSRAWDTEGVTSLRALNAPFLVDSDALVERVVTGDVGTRMMDGLSDGGVVGLALYPEGLRHLFAFAAPITSPAQLDGQVVRSPTSATVAAVFDAFGADVTDAPPSAATQVAVESAYVLGPKARYATGNLTLFPKVNVLVVNADDFAGLSDDDQAVLRDAATATQTWAIDDLEPDAAAAAAWCAAGNGVSVLTDGEVAAFEAAAAPVYDSLVQDDAVAEIIADIEALRDEVGAPPAVTPCDPAEEPVPDSVESSAEAASLVGVYRFEVTAAALRAAGEDEAAIADNAGVVTWDIDESGWCGYWDVSPGAGEPTECGTYVVQGDELWMTFPDGTVDHYRFEIIDNGDLQLTVIDVVPQYLPIATAWSAAPWTRIGD